MPVFFQHRRQGSFGVSASLRLRVRHQRRLDRLHRQRHRLQIAPTTTRTGTCSRLGSTVHGRVGVGGGVVQAWDVRRSWLGVERARRGGGLVPIEDIADRL